MLRRHTFYTTAVSLLKDTIFSDMGHKLDISSATVWCLLNYKKTNLKKTAGNTVVYKVHPSSVDELWVQLTYNTLYIPIKLK